MRTRTQSAHVPALFDVEAIKPDVTDTPKKAALEQVVWQGVCATPVVLQLEPRYEEHSQHFAATGSTRTTAATASAVAVETNERISVELELQLVDRTKVSCVVGADTKRRKEGNEKNNKTKQK